MKKINKYLSNFFKSTIDRDSKFHLHDYNIIEPSIKKKNLNIGAGRFYHPYCTNVDFDREWYKKFNMKIDIIF